MSLKLGLEEKRLRQLARDFRSQGYSVEVYPNTKRLKELGNYVPDLVANKEGETVIVEVKRRSKVQGDNELESIATLISHLPGWRFDLVVIENEKELESIDYISNQIRDAELLYSNGKKDAAILLLGAAAEGATRHLARSFGLAETSVNASSMAKRLYSLGRLTKKEYEQFTSFSRARNSLAHGVKSRKPSARQVVGFASIIRELLDA